MPIYLDLRFLLLVPALAAIAFMVWVFINLGRDIARQRRRYTAFNSRRRPERSEIWE